MNTGYVRIDRSILDWRWYSNINTFKLFFHLLLSANYCEAQFEQFTIKRGQLVTGRKQLSMDTGLTEKEVRNALKNLKSTNDITIKTTSKYSIITIPEYEKFQQTLLVKGQQRANDGPAKGQQRANEGPQYNKNKKNKKNKNNNKYTDENYDLDLELFKSKSLFKD